MISFSLAHVRNKIKQTKLAHNTQLDHLWVKPVRHDFLTSFIHISHTSSYVASFFYLFFHHERCRIYHTCKRDV
jgi:hypothetical protein